MYVCHGHRELLLEIPCILDLWQLIRAAEYTSCETLLSGVSTEAGVSQSTDEAGLSGSFMPLTPYCLLLTMAACGAHTVYPSPKVIQVKKKKKREEKSPIFL